MHNTNASLKIRPLFKEKPLPTYKLEQYRRFVLATKLLEEGRHFTLIGGQELLDLTYDMSLNSRRTVSKDELLRRHVYRINKRIEKSKI